MRWREERKCERKKDKEDKEVKEKDKEEENWSGGVSWRESFMKASCKRERNTQPAKTTKQVLKWCPDKIIVSADVTVSLHELDGPKMVNQDIPIKILQMLHKQMQEKIKEFNQHYLDQDMCWYCTDKKDQWTEFSK